MSLAVPNKLNSRLSQNGAVLFGGPGAITRQLPYFAGSQYATLNWTAAGDFEVEVVFATTNVTAQRNLLGTNDNTKMMYLNKTSGTLAATLIDAADNPFWITVSASNFADGKVNTAKLRRTGDEFGLSCNGGAEVTTTEVGAKPVTFEILGSASDWGYFIGHIFSLTLTDLDTPSNSVPTINLDSGSTVYELADGVSLGASVFTWGFDSLPSGWSELSEVLTATNVAQYINSKRYLNTQLEIDEWYLLEYTVSNYSSGSLYVDYNTGFSAFAGTTAIRTANGTYTELVQCDDVSASRGLVFNNASASALNAEITNITIQKAPNALVYKNFVAADWETFKRTYSPDAWTALDGDPVLELA